MVYVYIYSTLNYASIHEYIVHVSSVYYVKTRKPMNCFDIFFMSLQASTNLRNISKPMISLNES